MKRKNGNRLEVTFILALFFTAFFFVGLFSTPGQAAEEIKIGALLPFTGTMADYGPLCKVGIEMRIQEANYKAAGRSVKLILEDDGTDTSVALEKAKKLVEKDQVKVIIGPPNSGVASGIAPYLTQNKIISIGFLNHPIELARMGSIKVYPQTLYAAGMPTGWYAYDQLGYRKVTSLACDYVAGHRFVGGALDMFKQRGGEVVRQQLAPPGTADFGPYLVNMKKEKADAVIVWSISADLMRFIKQYHEFGLKLPVLIPVSSSLKTSYLEELGDIVVGIIGGLEYTWRLDNPLNKKFVETFENKFKIKPEKDHASSYVAASIVLAAIEATGGDLTHEKLDKAINGLKMNTIQGPLSFTPKGIAVTDRYICKAVKVSGKYMWDPVYTYPAVRDPRE